MPDRVGAGAALLVAGHGIVEANATLIPLLGRIGESLLATSPDWQLRRLSQIAGERDLPDRTGLKRHVHEVAALDVETLVVVIAGLVTTRAAEIALVTARDHRGNPDDATLPLRWIGGQLQKCRAERLVLAASFSSVSADADMTRGCLSTLRTGRAKQLVALDCVTPKSALRGEVLEALLDGLVGGALDRETGTITLRSLSEHLERVPGALLQQCEVSETLASSPPLAGPWDARLSRSATTASAEPEDLVGVVLPGRFRIDRALAAGSFGRVYVARQLAVDRDVAVKVLAHSVDPGSDIGRLFVHEIHAVGRLDHPNIVRVHQADITAGGRLFYAMELLEGRDLQQVIETEGMLSRERAIDLAIQLLSALAAAHGVGLVHADVKPANVFIATSASGAERLVLLDFGFARLRRSDQPVDSAGGTPAYMAPEQLREGRIDHRSDIFAAALVLVTMLTGWRRKRADALIPPLEEISDERLREVLRRALNIAPEDRYQTAWEFAESLGAAASGGASHDLAPFRHLAPFTERDRDRLYGRDREVTALVEHVLYRQAVIYTAPSGTGKTSLLRAGLAARLEVLGVTYVYLVCQDGVRERLATALVNLTAQRRTVIVVDQLEATLADAGAESAAFLRDLAEIDRRPASDNISLVLSVREDFLANVIAREGFGAIPVFRLGPLRIDAAREAIVKPLTERRLAITEDLLHALLSDLEAAVLAIAPELKWTGEPAVYPPHLQLACAVLYESLQPGEATLELRHYRALGGLDTIVGEYLERVLEAELPPALAPVARSTLTSLVNPNQTRAFCTESELVTNVPAGSPDDLATVLEVLRSRGIIVRLRSSTGELGWELVHDSLVPRVLAWLDRADLTRRRALDLVRHHLRRSRKDHPSLLNADELREVRDHDDAIAELDVEWSRRGAGAIRPGELVRQSRRRHRRQVLLRVASLLVAAAALLIFGYLWLAARAEQSRQDLLTRGDIGQFILEIELFDWDVEKQIPRPVAAQRAPFLDWEIIEPLGSDPLAPSEPPLLVQFERIELPGDGRTRRWRVEVRGGPAVLRVHGRGVGCGDSDLPLRRLPGYATRDHVRTFKVIVPTCQVTTADSVSVPAGPYASGGLPDPPPPMKVIGPNDFGKPGEVTLPAYSIDRTEVTNAAFRMFTAEVNTMSAVTFPRYNTNTPGMEHAGERTRPVLDIDWYGARAYCRFLGKTLPSDQQWEKAFRGGTTIAGEPNRGQRRAQPNMVPISWSRREPVPVGTVVEDRSPYGVMDLAGNVQEWTRTEILQGQVVTRGCTWLFCDGDLGPDYISIRNPRSPTYHDYGIGLRCALDRS